MSNTFAITSGRSDPSMFIKPSKLLARLSYLQVQVVVPQYVHSPATAGVTLAGVPLVVEPYVSGRHVEVAHA